MWQILLKSAESGFSFFLPCFFFFFEKHPAYVNVTTKISQEQVSRNPVGVYLSARMSCLARARSGQGTVLMLCCCLRTWSDLDMCSINRFLQGLNATLKITCKLQLIFQLWKWRITWGILVVSLSFSESPAATVEASVPEVAYKGQCSSVFSPRVCFSRTALPVYSNIFFTTRQPPLHRNSQNPSTARRRKSKGRQCELTPSNSSFSL